MSANSELTIPEQLINMDFTWDEIVQAYKILKINPKDQQPELLTVVTTILDRQQKSPKKGSKKKKSPKASSRLSTVSNADAAAAPSLIVSDLDTLLRMKMTKGQLRQYFKKIRIPGDGDCGYEAFRQGLIIAGGKKYRNANEVRFELYKKVDTYAEWPWNAQAATMALSENTTENDPYYSSKKVRVKERIMLGITDKGHPLTYATTTELQLLGDMFPDVCLYVWTQGTWQLLHPTQSRQTRICSKHVYLIHERGNHFNLLIPKRSSKTPHRKKTGSTPIRRQVLYNRLKPVEKGSVREVRKDNPFPDINWTTHIRDNFDMSEFREDEDCAYFAFIKTMKHHKIKVTDPKIQSILDIELVRGKPTPQAAKSLRQVLYNYMEQILLQKIMQKKLLLEKKQTAKKGSIALKRIRDKGWAQTEEIHGLAEMCGVVIIMEVTMGGMLNSASRSYIKREEDDLATLIRENRLVYMICHLPRHYQGLIPKTKKIWSMFKKQILESLPGRRGGSRTIGKHKFRKTLRKRRTSRRSKKIYSRKTRRTSRRRKKQTRKKRH